MKPIDSIKNIPEDSSQRKDSLVSRENPFTPFLLSGYSILDTAIGNLNLDAYPDRILVLKKNGEDSSSDVVLHPEKRPLMILLGKQDGQFHLAGRNDQVVLCVDCGGVMGDPYQGITIKNGYFSIEHYGGSAWRWTRVITFRYAPAEQNWFLFKDGGENFNAADPEGTRTSKVRTTKDFGKIPFADFDVFKDQ